jgi:hypothetical protein
VPNSIIETGFATAGRGLCWGKKLKSGDEMAEFAIDFLLSTEESSQALVHALAERWPDRPALEFALILSLAANGIENMLNNDRVRLRALDAWRMAALVGVYVYDAQALGLPHKTGRDLLAYWRTQGAA